MHRQRLRLLLRLLVPLLLALTPSSALHQGCGGPGAAAREVRAGYWLPHSGGGGGGSPAAQINPLLYTHVYYSALSLDEASFHVAPPPPDQLSVLSDFSTTVKNKNPRLKTLLSVSSAADQLSNSSATFSAMAGSAAGRAAFVNSSIELARKYAFDGLDLAWMFPSSPSNMANLAALLTEWRAAVNEEAKTFSPPLVLTATVYFSAHLFDNVDYPAQALAGSLDWVNALCFGHRSAGDVTAADAALYDLLSHQSASYGVSSWLDAGLPPCKLVMGIPLYGRSWFLKNKMKNGMGAEVVAAGPRLKFSNQSGIMAYQEIQGFRSDPAAEFTYDDRSVASYFHLGGLWVSFDSPQVVQAKIAYASKNGLLGYFLWPISFDSQNYTISEKASDAWEKYSATPGGETGSGSENDWSPVEPPSQDLGSAISAANSEFIGGPAAAHLRRLHHYLLVCILPFALMLVKAGLG